MHAPTTPTPIAIPGTALLPGFSVYLLKIDYKGELYYYVGMTEIPVILI